MFHLTKDELERYHRDGYLSSFDLCSPEAMAEVREKVDRLMEKETFLTDANHIEHKFLYDLITRPEIIDRAASILGEDIVLWRSNFFVKSPGDKAVPWHQDYNSWPLDPMINLTAWIAFEEATIENSCVWLIPGSHRKILLHVPTEKGTVQFNYEADPEFVNKQAAIPIELKPGQFFLFNERTLHYSAPNTSQKRRLGLTVRMTLPSVKVFVENLRNREQLMLVHGQDKFGLNSYIQPPAV
ncbi:MAG: phytanoyl-CoA dioxygenase [Paenibacillaceae bacterium]|jgi:ectoine hydroxylase-related dioxygenase (phytanoyl-CoA dioxygenase family)|nr:phytanoyl-CoA dioxygenase [Paenibacillaceae bacterium]